MNTPPVVATERVDDVPLLLGYMQHLDVARILDAHFETHGNHQGLSLKLHRDDLVGPYPLAL